MDIKNKQDVNEYNQLLQFSVMTMDSPHEQVQNALLSRIVNNMVCYQVADISIDSTNQPDRVI